MQPSPRLQWVDMAKGISIILVVMLYAAYSVGEDTAQTGILHWVIGFAAPFRMPEFFLISGLFLSNALARPLARYIDRRVLHYFYFYGLWALIHIALKALASAAGPAGVATDLLYALIEPYGVLWFIYMLAVFCLATRLIRMARLPHWLILAAAALMQMAPIDSASYIVTQFAEYFIYFYFGHVAAPRIFSLVDWASRHKAAAGALLAAWAVLNGALVFLPEHQFLPTRMVMGFGGLPGVTLILAIAGALAICVGAGLLAQRKTFGWLNWLGAHSLIIYLAFALPMSFTRILLMRTGLVSEVNTLSLLVFAAALAGPLVLYYLVRRTGWGAFLFERPQWARLPEQKPPAPAHAAAVRN